MKGRNKMDEDAKKNERELRKYRAKLRMDYYPLPLRWFKFFRYVSMILNIINCISGIISYILIAATINNPEAIEKIQAAFAEMSGTSGINMELFTVIAVADFLVTVYLLVLCVLVFKRMVFSPPLGTMMSAFRLLGSTKASCMGLTVVRY